jgi:hypothetical protein
MKYKGYLLHKLSIRAESEKEFLWNILNMARMDFDISEEVMTQPIYEN